MTKECYFFLVVSECLVLCTEREREKLGKEDKRILKEKQGENGVGEREESDGKW